MMRGLCLFAAFACSLVSSSLRGEDSSLENAIDRGVAFLLEDQNENGSWGSARQTKGLNIYAPVPGAHHSFRVAVTAMGVSALIESGKCDDPGPAADALVKAEAYLLEELPEVRRAAAKAIYNVWTHAYGLRALADMYPRSDEERQEEIVKLMNQQIERLGRFESIDGGWGYYDFRAQTARPSSSSISFTFSWPRHHKPIAA